jgi:AraC-like DNA-binding protein
VAYFPAPRIAAVASALAGRQVPEPFFAGEFLDDPELSRLYRALHSVSAPDDETLQFDELVFTTLRTALHRFAALRETPERSVGTAAARRAIDYLHANLGRRVRVAELISAAGVSERQLYRSFAETVGVSPHRYHLQLRLDRARRLLAQGSPIANVAARTGFADQSHFTRRFARFVGCTPSRYSSAAS